MCVMLYTTKPTATVTDTSFRGAVSERPPLPSVPIEVAPVLESLMLVWTLILRGTDGSLELEGGPRVRYLWEPAHADLRSQPMWLAPWRRSISHVSEILPEDKWMAGRGSLTSTG